MISCSYCSYLFKHIKVVPGNCWCEFLSSHRRCSAVRLACPPQVFPLCTAAVYLAWIGSEQRGWLRRSAHGLCAAAMGEPCAVHQVDLFTGREKEVKCLATRLRGQDNSLPVVLENYSSRAVFTRWRLLIPVMAFRATCSIKGTRVC